VKSRDRERVVEVECGCNSDIHRQFDIKKGYRWHFLIVL